MIRHESVSVRSVNVRSDSVVPPQISVEVVHLVKWFYLVVFAVRTTLRQNVIFDVRLP